MVDRDWQGEFLEAEQKAHDLVQVLEKLERDAARYRDLSRTIEGGASALASVAAGLEGFIPKVEQALGTVSQLGVPELRRDVDALGARLVQLQTKLDSSTEATKGLLAATLGTAVLGVALSLWIAFTG